ncbi:MAG: hypothetical protein A2149_05660 [Candidatus Schekmanbacteria bacterium RBG_16_38_11]|uniref:Uncharacterized protein n=1 Tax=Candidatus Schekmanbacteria bacterium RBG_16_38_11 TaxID=1817880 RepID=A0A1F7RYY0_9BACT|nr:MAG: hypothetical protein A2149_05660 [Candidatus Schekmanbacteria bacterium RBG_16_38_11]
MFEEVVKIIRRYSKFLITTHINSDGDGVGSEVALSNMLRVLGKEVIIINPTPLPENYRFLDKEGSIKIFSKEHINLINETEVVFVLDISNWERIGVLGTFIKESKAIKICIDHHISNTGFADLNIIDERASSTGEIIYDLVQSMGVTLDKRATEGLYAAILTDTGSFRFSNTTPKVHMIVSRLIEKGVNPYQIYEEVYEKRSPSRMKVLGLALTNLNLECSGKIAWFCVTQEMMGKFNLRADETESFVNQLNYINGVEVAIFFLEAEDNEVKVSLRSKGNVDVNVIANRLKGGGHSHAAGIRMNDSLKNAVNKVLAEVRKEFT